MDWRKSAVVAAAVGATAIPAAAALVITLRGVDQHPADRIDSYDFRDILERVNHSPASPPPTATGTEPAERSPIAPGSDRPNDLGHNDDDHPGDADDD